MGRFPGLSGESRKESQERVNLEELAGHVWTGKLLLFNAFEVIGKVYQPLEVNGE